MTVTSPAVLTRAANSDRSVPEPVVSGQSSDDPPADAANSDRSVPEPVVSGQSSDDPPAGATHSSREPSPYFTPDQRGGRGCRRSVTQPASRAA
jgi:hypothetical protein